MREMRGDLFDQIGRAEYICITTNGTVKNNGSAVLGRGCALQAKTRWNGLPEYLGSLLQVHGNLPFYLGAIDEFKFWRKGARAKNWNDTGLISFPVKHVWNQMADIDLIKRSCAHLISMINYQQTDRVTKIENVIIPRPGCGNGNLEWGYVRPAIAPLLDDRFVIITNENSP